MSAIGSAPFTVMSFNIRGSIYDDGANAWPHRADLNVVTIKQHAPDLIGFQEAQRGNMQVYAAELSDYDHEAGPPVTRHGESEQRLPIFWRRNRLEKLESGSFYLSDTPDVWSQGWGATFIRGANWVRLRDRETGQTVVHLNTHLDHETHAARLNGSRLIIERLSALRNGAPAIVTADFNDPAVKQGTFEWPGPRVHDLYTAHGFRDTFRAAGHTDGLGVNSFHDFQGTDFMQIGFRIDWILTLDGTTRLETRSAAIITDGNTSADPPIYPSDHYPVVASLAFGPPTA